MKILALDASSHACSAAVIEDGRVAAHALQEQERGQAEALIPLAAGVLAEAGLACAGADIVACAVGPGSFTGLRIGLSAARGLVLATGRRFAGVTSFEALAAAVPEDERKGRTILAAVDAKRAEIFVQLLDENLDPVGGPAAVTPDKIPDILPAGPLLVAGDGAPALQKVLAARPGTKFSQASNCLDARYVGLAVWNRLRTGKAVLPPVPLYLRAPDVTFSKKQKPPDGKA